MKHWKQFLLIWLWLLCLPFVAWAEQRTYTFSKAGFILTYQLKSNKEIVLISLENTTHQEYKLFINRVEQLDEVLKPGALYKYGKACSNVAISPLGSTNGPMYLWYKDNTEVAWEKAMLSNEVASPNGNSNKSSTSNNTNITFESNTPSSYSNTSGANKKNASPISVVSKDASTQVTNTSEMVIANFVSELNRGGYLSNASIDELCAEVSAYLNDLRKTDNKVTVIAERQIDKYLALQLDRLQSQRTATDEVISRFLSSSYGDQSNLLRDNDVRGEMERVVDSRLQRVETSLQSLQSALDESMLESGENPNHQLLSFVLGGVVLLLVIVPVVVIGRKQARKKKSRPVSSPVSYPSSPATNTNGSPNMGTGITIVRRTTSLLKKQCLDDVYDNPAYLLINSADICNDSGVRRIYIKNSCIKDIYNMYADDLRNEDNPKEDGCMVLGRWVYVPEVDQYDISLEEVVKPGDDAIFKEYELNFGGKIKIKVSQRLKNLRASTGLQYDLTCWVHSHPGLEVFFSDADSSVHDMLKNPVHPRFLIAIVVDILTNDQKLGIFTYTQDGSFINSHNDFKRYFSLDEWNRWAIKSQRSSIDVGDSFNMLSTAQTTSSCGGIYLTNGAIIDISQLAMEQQQGLVGKVCGFSQANNVYLVSSVGHTDEQGDVIGCMVVGTRLSLPTIRRAIADYLEGIAFVVYYSMVEDTVIAIPMTNGQLDTDESKYGVVKLEKLNLWTRRRR